jgi:hypothetical protein
MTLVQWISPSVNEKCIPSDPAICFVTSNRASSLWPKEKKAEHNELNAMVLVCIPLKYVVVEAGAAR